MSSRPVMLMILDGWGWRDDRDNNAVLLAKTPNFDRFWASSPHAFLRTSGLDVGLPEGCIISEDVGPTTPKGTGKNMCVARVNVVTNVISDDLTLTIGRVEFQP